MGLDYDDIEQEYLTVDSTDYFIDGSIIFTNGKFSKILFDEGYVNADYVRAGPYCRMRPYKHAGMSDEQFAELMKRWIASMNRKRTVLSFKFYNKDHLGNIREVVSKSDSIEQVNEYYPFGTPIHDLSNNPEFQPFKYNGKELDMMHGLNTLDYGARQYNPVLPVWDRVDQLAEKYYNISPYAYCNNDPVNKIDPDGRDVWIYFIGNNGQKQRFHFNGEANVSHENQFVNDFLQAYYHLIRHGAGDNIRKAVREKSYSINVIEGDESEYVYSDNNKTIVWASRTAIKTEDDGCVSPATLLEHEFDHAVHQSDYPTEHEMLSKKPDKHYTNAEERRVMENSERKTAFLLGEHGRHFHTGTSYITDGPTTIRRQRIWKTYGITPWRNIPIRLRKDKTTVKYE